MYEYRAGDPDENIVVETASDGNSEALSSTILENSSSALSHVPSLGN
jgi:hypothetical protein